MSVNPFLEYPFWHYYTLHMQNVSLMTDEFRKVHPGDRPITLDKLLSADISTPSRVLGDVIIQCMFYDFINDSITRLDRNSVSRVYVLTTGMLFQSILDTLPRDAIIVIKGLVNSAGSGGEMLPLLMSPLNIGTIVKALGVAQSLAKGITTDSNGDPIQKVDVISLLPVEDRERVLLLLNRPIYQNMTISSILRSYRRQGSGISDLSRSIGRIKNQLSKVIPEGKAINVASGAPVNAAASCYNVVELQVRPTNASEYRTIKFAYKTGLSDEDRSIYEQMLKKEFDAKPVQATEVSVDQRRSIMLQPVVASFKDYRSLFRSNEGFQSYIQRLNEATASQSIDTSQTLHSNIDDEEEDIDIDEDEDIDIDDL